MEDGHEPSWPLSNRLLRPIWIAAWVGMTVAALLLANLIPRAWWLIVFIPAVGLLALGERAYAQSRPEAYQWLLGGPVVLGSAFAYGIGVSMLLSEAFDPLTIGIMGLICLFLVVWIETIALQLDEGRRGTARPPTGS